MRIVELIENHGIAAMHEPHIKHLEGKLWEMRMMGKDGIARAIYVTASGERVVVVHALGRRRRKPRSYARDRSESGEGGGVMSIPVKRIKKRWMKEPGFKEGYDALEEEFLLAGILIEARDSIPIVPGGPCKTHGYIPVDDRAPRKRNGQTEPIDPSNVSRKQQERASVSQSNLPRSHGSDGRGERPRLIAATREARRLPRV